MTHIDFQTKRVSGDAHNSTHEVWCDSHLIGRIRGRRPAGVSKWKWEGWLNGYARPVWGSSRLDVAKAMLRIHQERQP